MYTGTPIAWFIAWFSFSAKGGVPITSIQLIQTIATFCGGKLKTWTQTQKLSLGLVHIKMGVSRPWNQKNDSFGVWVGFLKTLVLPPRPWTISWRIVRSLVQTEFLVKLIVALVSPQPFVSQTAQVILYQTNSIMSKYSKRFMVKFLC